MKKKFVKIEVPANYTGIANEFKISPLLAKLIANREVKDINKYLRGTVDDLYNPFIFPDMKKAVFLVKEAIFLKKKILIVNDYDVDGVCSGYILLKALKMLKANVYIYTPKRLSDGYGINTSIVEKAIDEKIEMIITCDNGISAKDAIDMAKEHGINVIVTDHHEIPDYKVNADAIINPKLGYPDRNLCGTGVAYKFIQALFFNSNLEKTERLFLEFVALATVCDVVPLIDENRIFVKEGFKNVYNLGLKRLMQKCGVDKLNVYNCGFLIGPCINAAGRLSDAKLALDLFTETNDLEIERIVDNLINLNENRKELTNDAISLAKTLVNDNNIIILHMPNLHASIAGIVAGKIKEEFYRPTIVFTGAGEILKGSGRSVEGFHMFNELSKHKELLETFGGHEMAAGMSINRANLNEFIKVINKDSQVYTEIIKIDSIIGFEYFNIDTIKELEIMAPFGIGNPAPVFADNKIITSAKIIGKNKNTVKMTLNNALDAIKFNEPDFDLSVIGNNHWFTYKPNINEYMGNTYVQCIIKDFI